jgi:hypothetical protein
MLFIRAISEMKTAAKMPSFGENDPKLTPFAGMTPRRRSGVDVKS